MERDRDKTVVNNITPANIYESVCVPDLSELLGGYQSSEEKSQKTSSSAASAPPPPPPPSAGSHHPAQYHMTDGKFSIFFLKLFLLKSYDAWKVLCKV